MLGNLDHFRSEHVEILAVVEEMQHLLTPSAVTKKSAILEELVTELTRLTLAHLLQEDRFLYQEMLLSAHDETRALAQQHVASMGNIAENLRDYVRSWQSSEQIKADPAAFCDDTKRILETLEIRIGREEKLLYPRVEALRP